MVEQRFHVYNLYQCDYLMIDRLQKFYSAYLNVYSLHFLLNCIREERNETLRKVEVIRV